MHFLLTRLKPRALGYVLAVPLLLIERIARSISGIQITDQAHLGPGLLFTHEGGIVIGPVRLGSNCTVSHGVTIGRSEVEAGPGYGDTPVLGDRVWLGPGAVVAGPLSIGSDCAIGANSVVLRDTAARAVVLGVPARVISFKGSFHQVHYRGMHTDPDRLDSQRVTVVDITGPRPSTEGTEAKSEAGTEAKSETESGTGSDSDSAARAGTGSDVVADKEHVG